MEEHDRRPQNDDRPGEKELAPPGVVVSDRPDCGVRQEHDLDRGGRGYGPRCLASRDLAKIHDSDYPDRTVSCATADLHTSWWIELLLPVDSRQGPRTCRTYPRAGANRCCVDSVRMPLLGRPRSVSGAEIRSKSSKEYACKAATEC